MLLNSYYYRLIGVSVYRWVWFIWGGGVCCFGCVRIVGFVFGGGGRVVVGILRMDFIVWFVGFGKVCCIF